MTETQKFLLTITVSLLTSSLFTTIFTAWFQRRSAARFEQEKAALQRRQQIHVRQVEAVLVILAKLEHALFYMQRLASAGRLIGESDQKLWQGAAQELAAASETFSQNRPLIGKALAASIDEFFTKTISAQQNISLAMNPMTPDGHTRAGFVDEGRKIAYRELPLVLESIRTEAEAVIHS